MRVHRRATELIAILLCSMIVVGGRSAAVNAQFPSFRSGVDVVAVTVTVTDSSGRYIGDLGREHFQIFEDGRPQEVTFFQPRQLPLALALLIDTSASMEPHLGVAQDAATGFVRALGPADMATVVDFATGVRIGQEFTTDRAALERAIRSTTALGSTALYNAVYIALGELKLMRNNCTVSTMRFGRNCRISTFSPTNRATRGETVRHVTVRVDRPSAIVRARPGYFAGSR